MIGMKAGETKDINVTFPENYGQADLAGKAAVFKVTVHEVKEEKFPEFTDEYVKGLNVAGAQTFAELQDAKKKELEAAKAQAEKDRQFDYIVNQILDAAKVDMPKSMIQERVDQFKSQYEQQAKMYNIPFEKFVELMGTTIEQFNDQANRQAERQALFNVVASKIIEVEKLAPSKEAIEAKAEEDSKLNKKSKEENLQANYARYYSDLAYQALVDLLLSNAKEVAEEPKKAATAEKAAAPKKTAAKSTTTKKTTTAKKAETAEKKPAAKKTTTAKKTTKKAE
jgi:trigger factor